VLRRLSTLTIRIENCGLKVAREAFVTQPGELVQSCRARRKVVAIQLRRARVCARGLIDLKESLCILDHDDWIGQLGRMRHRDEGEYRDTPRDE